ncbi:MAG: 30S ribosomal protein S8 [Aquirufa sp.]|jgi:small subunit ribosomal protein S8
MTNDTISDRLTRVRNAIRVQSPTVTVPKTRSTASIASILVREGFVETCESTDQGRELRLKYRGADRTPVLTNLKRISRPGLRVYANHKEIPQILGGLGVVILSTSQGWLTDREARVRCLGGELVCSVW